jgi:spore maturation protein CgeB
MAADPVSRPGHLHMRDIAFAAQIPHLEELKQNDTSFNRTAVQGYMKILIPGWTAPHSFETACTRELRKLGVEVFNFENKPRYPWNFGRSWWNLTLPERFLNDAITSWRLYRTVERVRPDWVFMTKGENLRAEIFTMIKRKFGTHLAIWYVDNPFHANVSSYQALRHIQKADIYFIWAKYLIDPLISAGAKRVEFLPFAFDPTTFPDVEIPQIEAKHWQSDVCFVGTWDKEREAALLPLAGKRFDLAVYGQGWTRFLPDDSPLRQHVRADAIWLKDVVKALKGAKIVLNLLRQHNWKGHNFRTMEAAGVGGGVLLTPYTDEQAKVLFREDREIFCYQDKTPSLNQVAELLARPDLLQNASSAARGCVFQDHLLEHRLKTIIETMKATQ